MRQVSCHGGMSEHLPRRPDYDRDVGRHNGSRAQGDAQGGDAAAGARSVTATAGAVVVGQTARAISHGSGVLRLRTPLRHVLRHTDPLRVR